MVVGRGLPVLQRGCLILLPLGLVDLGAPVTAWSANPAVNDADTDAVLALILGLAAGALINTVAARVGDRREHHDSGGRSVG